MGRAWSGASGSIFTKGLGRDRCVCCFCITLCFNAGVEGVVKKIPRSIRPLPPHTETVIIIQPYPGPLLSMHGQDVIHVSHQLAALLRIPFSPNGCIRHKEVQPFTNLIDRDDCSFSVQGGSGRILLRGSRS